MMFIYFMTTLITFTWVLSLVLGKKHEHPKSIFLIPFGLFFASQALSTIFSIDRQTSLLGYYGRFNGGLLSISSYLLLFYIFLDSFDKKYLKQFLLVSLVSSVLVIAWGLPGKFGHDLSCLIFTHSFDVSCWTKDFHPTERMFSTLGQPNWLGAYLSIHFFIGLYFLFSHAKKHLQTILFAAYCVLTFIAILFTRSDSAIAATVISFLCFSMLAFIQSPAKKDTAKKVLGVGFTLLLLIAVIKTGSTRIDTFFTFQKKQTQSAVVQPITAYSVNKVTDSWEIRKIVWKGAVEVGKMYPLFGTGVETFAYSYNFKRPIEHNLTSEWDFIYNKAHNEFLNYFATTGYVGLIAYMVIIISVIYFLLRRIFIGNSKLLACSLLAAYLSIIITNFFGFSTTTINLFFYLIPAFLMVKNKGQKQEELVALKINDIRRLLALALIIFVFLFSVDYLVRYFMADLKYATVDSSMKSGKYQVAAATLNYTLEHLHYEHVYEDKLSFLLANLSFFAAYEKEKDLSQKLVLLSDTYNARSLRASRANQSYWKTRAKNYYLYYQSTLNVSDLQKGEDALKTGEIFAPIDPHFPYNLALYYTLHSDEVKDKNEVQKYKDLSLQSVGKALSLKSNYEDAYFLKGQLLKKYGEKDEAKKVFEFIINSIDPANKEAQKELGSL